MGARGDAKTAEYEHHRKQRAGQKAEHEGERLEVVAVAAYVVGGSSSRRNSTSS
jgi:hypothetical protein